MVSENSFKSTQGTQKLSFWTKINYPPKGFAKVNRIVLSQGLEVDNIKFYMKIDVPLNVIRLEVNSKTLEEQLKRNDISILNRDDLIRKEATVGLMTEVKAMKDR